MKIVLTILLSFVFLLGYSQSNPSGFPTQSNLGWQKWGWQQSDSGTIIANRLPNFTPRLPGTTILHQDNGVDTTLKFWTGSRWLQLALQNNIVANTNMANTDLTVLANRLHKGGKFNWQFDSVANLSFTNASTYSLSAVGANGGTVSNVFLLAFPNSGQSTFSLSHRRRNTANSADSIQTYIGDISPTEMELRSSLPLLNKSATVRTEVQPTSGLTKIKLLSDSLFLSAIPKATSDSIAAFGAPDPLTGARPIYIIPAPSSGSGTVTSVALSMPSAFNVSGSPITTNGTISVSGAGTSAQYIRGNGTLATFDTAAIPSFSAKVRSLFSGSSPVTYNEATGTFGLADLVTAGACTNCNVTYNAKGQAILYSSGTGGGSTDTAINIGSGIGIFESKTNDTFNFKSITEGFGINLTENANDVNIKVDTTDIATQYDLTQISVSQPANQIVFGTGSGISSEAANIYNPANNTQFTDSVKVLKLVTDSFAILGAKTVIGQLEPSYTWQRNQQWYDDGAYPGIFTIVNTDSVDCVNCVPGQTLSNSDSTGGRGLVIATYSESTGGNFIRTMKARGNWLHPSPILAGDILTGLGAWGFGTTEFSGSAAGFHIAAAENFTDAAWGTEIQFFTTPNGTQGRTYNQIMKQDGSTLFGGTINAPSENISGTGSRFLTINSTDGGAPFVRFQRTDATQAVFGTASTTDQFLTGSIANDFIIRAGDQGVSSANILFSIDASNIALKLNTSGQLQLPNVAGADTRVATWSSTGIAGTISNSSNGDVLTIVGGVPVFATPPTAHTLQDVTDAGNTTDNSVIFQSAGTDDDIELKAVQVDDNIATFSFRAAQGTNSATGIRLMPRGTGFSSIMKANIDLFNTDQEADGTNYEDLRIGATGTTGYIINSLKAGTGTVRPINFQMNSSNVLTISEAGEINIGDFTDKGSYTFQNTGGLYQSGRVALNYDYMGQAKTNGNNPYSSTIGATSANYWQFGATPTGIGSFTRGVGIVVDTLNNVGIGSNPVATMPLYNTGNSAFINGLQSFLGNFYRVGTITTDGTLTPVGNFYVIDASGGNITITLPAASTCIGAAMGWDAIFKRIDNSLSNTVTIQVNAVPGTDTIDGASSFTLTTQYESKRIRTISTSAFALY